MVYWNTCLFAVVSYVIFSLYGIILTRPVLVLPSPTPGTIVLSGLEADDKYSLFVTTLLLRPANDTNDREINVIFLLRVCT